MTTRIRIPAPLRPFTEQQGEVEVGPAGTVAEALQQLSRRYAPLRRHLYTEDGELRSYVNVYLNEDDIRALDGPHTPVHEGDVVTIVPSIAGGTEDAATRGRGDTAGESAAPHAPSPRRPLAAAAEAEWAGLTQDEVARYSRHIVMPEVGLEGQRRLRDARVLVVGAGGLGSPLGLYLAAAGVGRIGLVDFDVVDITNLQRQVLYGTGDVGRRKLEAAVQRLRDLNPHVHVEPHALRLTSENALEVLAGYDVVVDGTDNFPTRYLINDACGLLGKPYVYGSIFRFEGQVSVFDAASGPCYRCLFREPPPPGLVPSCAEGGVLGVLPGIIGSLQALETIKLILGGGETLVGRLLLFDALAMRWRELRLRKNPDCPLCGDSPSITGLIDYEEFCGMAPAHAGADAGTVPELEPVELKQRLDRGDPLTLIDVREPFEWNMGSLEPYGARLIPLGELAQRIDEVDPEGELVLYCRSGARSRRAAEALLEAGFPRVWNLRGGMLAWSDQVDPSIPKY